MLCMVLLACLAGLTASVAASASVIQVDGTILGPPAWAGSNALVAVNAGKETAVELVDPASGEARKVAALTGEYRTPRAVVLGTGYVFEGTRWGCGSRECTRSEPGGLDARDLFLTSPGRALRCLAQLYQEGCGSPRTCVVGSAVVSGPLLAYPSCSNGEDETGRRPARLAARLRPGRLRLRRHGRAHT